VMSYPEIYRKINTTRTIGARIPTISGTASLFIAFTITNRTRSDYL
jgi:hypothetical protein